MKILVIGRGGRESAIVKKVLSSPMVKEVYCAPGNAQTSKICNNIDIEEININKMLEFAKFKKIDLTIVGPESALERGIVDLFKSHNLMIFGPTESATKIESSKSYSKMIMEKYGIATASYKEFTNSMEAKLYAKEISYPHVIKYDGLAAGKGVVIVNDLDEMNDQIENMLDNKSFGDASRVIIEEFLEGEEFTLLSLVKDKKVYPLEISRDYKRAFDNDEGKNTGGMGAICPFDKISSVSKKQAIEILNQTANALVSENNNFTGVLYGGFIATEDGVKVIEFNARFGDPETEVVLSKLNSDLVEQILNLLNDREVQIINNNNYYVGITVAAKGYPEEYLKGININDYDDDGIFHMGTKLIDGKVISSGGRVIFVSDFGKTKEEARNNVYDKVKKFEDKNLFYRKDIGK